MDDELFADGLPAIRPERSDPAQRHVNGKPEWLVVLHRLCEQISALQCGNDPEGEFLRGDLGTQLAFFLQSGQTAGQSVPQGIEGRRQQTVSVAGTADELIGQRAERASVPRIVVQTVPPDASDNPTSEACEPACHGRFRAADQGDCTVAGVTPEPRHSGSSQTGWLTDFIHNHKLDETVHSRR
ncbi:hypothetical protein GCM10009658_76220 [Planotetraspora silvatica]|nr:hypothetical protein [Planotetraspora silvatica]